jgi:uncharacterized protein (DUF1697 family)
VEKKGVSIAFFRALNVGGHAVVKMADLQVAFGRAGCKEVRTYIQSGNVLFEPPKTSEAAFRKRLSVEVGALIGAEPQIIFRTADELRRTVRAAPFGKLEGTAEVGCYVVLLGEEPKARPRIPLVSEKEALEVIALKGLEAYVLCHRKKDGRPGNPNAFLEKTLGVRATTRNISTLTKMVALLPG